jgi:NADH:ubiquinone reductase (non-electrogenic)
VQARIGQLLELASLPGVSDTEQKSLLHIAIIGGDPTEVEIAAELSDLLTDDYAKVYPHLKGKMLISIFDAAPFILGAFEESLREYALTSFTKRHVQVHTVVKITQVSQNSMTTQQLGEIGCGMVLWVTGNKQCPLVDRLKVAKTAHLPPILTDTSLRVLSQDKTPIPGVSGIGDAADIEDQTLPTTAGVAVQKASYLAPAFNSDKFDASFRYKQKTLVAYIGGHDGVVQGKADWSGSRA